MRYIPPKFVLLGFFQFYRKTNYVLPPEEEVSMENDVEEPYSSNNTRRFFRRRRQFNDKQDQSVESGSDANLEQVKVNTMIKTMRFP